MKSIFTLLLLFVYSWAYAQILPSDGLDKVRIIETDKTIQAEILPVNHTLKPKANKFYYWYSANKVLVTQGGFSGQLLNGEYIEFYQNKNLKAQGKFKNGLKTGECKSWKENGTLIEIVLWKDGLIYVKRPSHFWKDINLIRRFKKKPIIDTASKSKN